MNTHLDALRQRRKVLQNPYAFADELEELQALGRDRLRLENPYAHADDVAKGDRPIARFDGMAQDKRVGPLRRRRFSEARLEGEVRRIQRRLWANRKNLFGREDIEPVVVLDPLAALESEGYQVLEAETLGQFATLDGVMDVAGFIDKPRKIIQVSRQFSRLEQRFTLAHELAHAVLHESISMHRDRPVEGSTAPVDPDEREANRFATLFLMPEKLVQKEFEDRFGATPFRFDERTIFGGKPPRGVPLQRAAARSLATTTSYGGLRFLSLVEYFRVSKEAMAIRLEELGLFILSNDLSVRGKR